ncbi:hypothetical protein BS78_07G025000 [Paspalum vaginatum]|nr:hypothetical protein BS78_07G025000 [Paspalum vaginatum]
MDGCNADTRIILIPDAVPPPPPQEVVAIDEKMVKTTARLEEDFSKVETKIHRFPSALRGISGGEDDCRYISPSVVAIGPYHRGAARLQKMEEVKLAAAYYLCKNTGYSTLQVYEKVLSVVGAARGCYDADDPSVAGFSDADFAAMMFLDACFLLQYMVSDTKLPVLQNRMSLSTGPSIHKDIFLLENQIPWLVMEVLKEFLNVDVHFFVAEMGKKFHRGKKPKKDRRRWMPSWMGRSHAGGSVEQYRPPHLLGLLWYTLGGFITTAHGMNYTTFSSSSWSSSAVELAEIGVMPTPSTYVWFGDMHVRRGYLSGELVLSPVFLSDVTACWLVNLAALEASTAGARKKDMSESEDGLVVTSYLSVLAMLMDREEDAHELRRRLVLHGTLSNNQALDFFKGLAQHLPVGGRYLAALEEVDAYKRHRTVRIWAHRLIYHSFKAMTIATLFSIVGVLVGIFKTLLDNKRGYEKQ